MTGVYSRIPWRSQFGDTLCWYCINAYGGCAWSQKDADPVDGWDAFRIDLNAPFLHRGVARNRKLESYIIVDCPQFDLDGRFSGDYALWSKRKAITLAKKKRREQRKRK